MLYSLLFSVTASPATTPSAIQKLLEQNMAQTPLNQLAVRVVGHINPFTVAVGMSVLAGLPAGSVSARIHLQGLELSIFLLLRESLLRACELDFLRKFRIRALEDGAWVDDIPYDKSDAHGRSV